MDLSTWLLMGTIGLMVANRALHIGEHWYRRRVLFWTLQLTNFIVSCLLVTVGIAGFTGSLRIVNLMLAGLLILHTVQNNRHYLAARRGLGSASENSREDLRAQVLEKLKGDDFSPRGDS